LVTSVGRFDSFTEWLKVRRTRGIDVVTEEVTVPDTFTTLVAAAAPALVEETSDVVSSASARREVVRKR
jgi:hypothetical protein